jgi:hypothetical protein
LERGKYVTAPQSPSPGVEVFVAAGDENCCCEFESKKEDAAIEEATTINIVVRTIDLFEIISNQDPKFLKPVVVAFAIAYSNPLHIRAFPS